MINSLLNLFKSFEKPKTAVNDDVVATVSLQSNNLLKYLILPVITLISCVGILLFVLIPQFQEYFKVNELIQETEVKTQNLSTKSQILRQVSEEEYTQSLKTALLSLPVEKDYITALSQVQTLADEANVQLTGISILDIPSPGAGEQNFQIKIVTSSNIESIKQFISLINQAPRVMKVSGIELTGGKNASSYQSQLTVTSYYTPLVKEAISLDKPIIALSDQEISLLDNLTKEVTALPDFSSSSNVATKPDPFE